MPQEEVNVLREWDFNVNLSGVAAPTGGAGSKLPQGYYPVTITDMYVNPANNSNRVIVKATVSEGPFAGVVRTDGLGIPKGPEDKVRHYWRGLAESVGYGPAQLDAGAISLGINTFKGRSGYIHFMPKAEDGGEGEFERVTWLAPAEWNQQKQAFEMAAAVAPAVAAPAGSALGSAQAAPSPLGATPAAAPVAAVAAPAALGAAAPAALPAAAPAAVGGGNTSKAALLAQLGVPQG